MNYRYYIMHFCLQLQRYSKIYVDVEHWSLCKIRSCRKKRKGQTKYRNLINIEILLLHFYSLIFWLLFYLNREFGQFWRYSDFYRCYIRFVNNLILFSIKNLSRVKILLENSDWFIIKLECVTGISNNQLVIINSY